MKTGSIAPLLAALLAVGAGTARADTTASWTFGWWAHYTVSCPFGGCVDGFDESGSFTLTLPINYAGPAPTEPFDYMADATATAVVDDGFLESYDYALDDGYETTVVALDEWGGSGTDSFFAEGAGTADGKIQFWLESATVPVPEPRGDLTLLGGAAVLALAGARRGRTAGAGRPR